ncbi:hypothetical protein TrRE_jg7930 [Triparma retinervis]|uniref:NADPH--hemoprotein reductase n=1 Tax=Triparma retinervis TaxID=2557542 RepID=A0A9W7E8H0_9STRA|nr:hypothetical protein TrRE_jg7930 [Triparma retinervis]
MRDSGRFDEYLDPDSLLAVSLKSPENSAVGEGLTGTRTLRELLTSRVDLGYTGVDVNSMHALSLYVDLSVGSGKGGGDSQYDKLVSMSTGSGEALFRDYVVRERRGLPDVLEEFDAVWGEGGITMEGLMEVFREMQPREFSIASSPGDTREKGTVEILAAVKKGTTRLGRRKEGMDDYYSSEWGDLGVLVWKAESQAGVAKVYVQDVVREREEEVADVILRRKGALLIAGGAKMASAVAREVGRILGDKISGGGMNSEKVGRKVMEGLRKKGRYAVESWT